MNPNPDRNRTPSLRRIVLTVELETRLTLKQVKAQVRNTRFVTEHGEPVRVRQVQANSISVEPDPTS